MTSGRDELREQVAATDTIDLGNAVREALVSWLPDPVNRFLAAASLMDIVDTWVGAEHEQVTARENLVWRLVAEAHRKYPDAATHWVNADDLRAALNGSAEVTLADAAVARVRALCDEAEAKGQALQAIPELRLVGNAYVGMAARTRRALKDVSDGK